MSFSIDDFTIMNNYNDNNNENLSTEDRLEMTKLLYDRYLKRKESNSIIINDKSNDNFQKDMILDELNKLNVSFNKLKLAVDNISAKFDQVMMVDNKKKFNLNNNEDHDNMTMISDDIEILDNNNVVPNETMLSTKMNNMNIIDADDEINNCDSICSNDYYQNEFYQHWYRNFCRQNSTTSTSSLNEISINKWLYHYSNLPKIQKFTTTIMPYSREIDLDFWLIKIN